MHFSFKQHIVSFFPADASASSLDLDGLDLYAEEWYADCLNDAETPILPDDLYVSIFLFVYFSVYYPTCLIN